MHSSPIGGVRATPLFAPRTPGTLTAMDATCSSSTVATWRGAMAGLAVRQVSEPRARPWRTPALNARTASVYARHMYDQYNTSIRIPGLSDCLEQNCKRTAAAPIIHLPVHRLETLTVHSLARGPFVLCQRSRPPQRWPWSRRRNRRQGRHPTTLKMTSPPRWTKRLQTGAHRGLPLSHRGARWALLATAVTVTTDTQPPSPIG